MNAFVRFLRQLLFFIALILAADLHADEVFAGRTIVIDPGHGGGANAGTDAAKNKSTANNATSATLGVKEKDVTLELSKLIALRITASGEAKAGKVRVVLTRDTDVNLNFTQRADIAAAAGGACFGAIHFNGDDSQRVSGPRAIIQQTSKNPEYEADKAFGLALAKAVETASKTFRPKTPAASFHDDRELHSGWGSYLFHQLNSNPKTRLIPACHLEVEFLDNRELEKLFFAEKKKEVFAAWADAIAGELIRQVLIKP
ncbi:MAG: N-acetylmuramoyl-L-alanine amidase [Verrucomicrobiota bacterium]